MAERGNNLRERPGGAMHGPGAEECIAAGSGPSWIRVRGYHKQYSFFCEGTVRALSRWAGMPSGASRIASIAGCTRARM